MAKIGILTFHRSHNWGAVLQAYASQEVLSKLGHKAEMIDYTPTSKLKMYKPRCRFCKNPKALLINICRYILENKEYRIRYNAFNGFIEKNLNLSKPFTDHFPTSVNNYDVVYIGSDQVWRAENAAEGGNYYWGNLNVAQSTKIISYAASMEAKSLSTEQEYFCRNNLNNFDHISVRESFLATILQPLTKKKIHTVLDPTLLLEKEDYLRIASDTVIEGEYLLIYELIKNPQVDLMAQQIAKEHNLAVVKIYIPLIGNQTRERDSGFTYISPSPSEFLRLFSDAQFVVTNSFHGTAFSIIFEKQFVSVETPGRTSRIESLLKMIGIEDQAYYKNKVFDKVTPNYINYDLVFRRLKEFKNQSIQFIDNSIEQ